MMTTKLARTLRDLRGMKGASLREVQEATGISNAYLSQLERDEVENPAPPKLRKLADYYGVSYLSLMEAAGYLPPDAPASQKPQRKKLTPFQEAILGLDFTEAEEQEALSMLGYIRSKRG